MDQQVSGSTPVVATPLPLSYKDRSAGLTAFGILTILLGCVVALFVPLMLVGQVMAARTTGAATPFSAILPAMLMYGCMAVALVWLGIGSIKARRWARALLLIFSWSWLVMGVVALVFMAFTMPKIMANLPSNGTSGQPAMPPGAMAIMMVIMFLIFGVIFVALPAVWTFFYGSRHVKATCETRDPVIRWTDACPLPVLGICVWLALGAPLMLIVPLAGHCVMPFFGMLLTGLPATIYCLVSAAIWGYGAWSLYHLDQRGWWVMLIAFCMLMLSGFLTFARHDILEMYQLMNYPAAQIEQMQKTGLLAGNRMVWLMAFSMFPLFGYLIFIRRFLPHKS